MVEIIRADLHNPRHGEALIYRCWTHTPGTRWGGSPLANEVKANLANALAARSGAHVLLAWVDGQPGWRCHLLRGLLDLRLPAAAQYPRSGGAPAQRGRGIGKRLLAERSDSPGSSVAAS